MNRVTPQSNHSKLSKRISQRAGQGFTILEILVATAVLALLMAILAQIVASTTTATQVTARQSRAMTEARTALDFLSFDVTRALRRPDLGFEINTEGPTPVLSFYSAVGTAPGERPVSLVRYRLVFPDDDYETGGWVREVVGSRWDADDGFTPEFSGQNPPVIPDPAGIISESLAPDVIAWDVSFIDRQSRQILREVTDPTRIGALQVTLAVLDRDFRRQLDGQYPDLPTVGVNDPAAPLWTNAVNQASFADAGPGSRVQIIDRTIPLP